MAEKDSATPQKAFKSCVECRRRKIRCAWTKEDPRTCRRCQERGVPCIPQVASHRETISRASSKARISQLESEVKQLRHAVFTIQKQLLSKHADGDSFMQRTPSIADQHNDIDITGGQDDGEDDSDDASSASSEILLQDRPSHMDPLFQNELLTTNAQRNIQVQQIQQGRTLSQRLETARKALQPLIPTEEQLAYLGSHVSSWLILLQDLAPTTSLADSKEGIIASYPLMKEPDVDPLKLACWLLALAITAQQLRPQVSTPQTPEKFRTGFPQAIQRAVETHIISHDSLCGTVAGLETCLMFLRFNLMKGIIQKSWLGLRRIISIAELIGLPRASRLLQQRSTDSTTSVDPHTVAKAKLWESICSVERLAGTLMHFPIATRHYSMTIYEPLVLNGVVNVPTFAIKLGNIAVQLNDIDEMASIPGTETELYSQVLRLDNEMRLLASEIPKIWWQTTTTDNVIAGDIIKFQFHCISMRIHLPFVVRSDSQDRFAFSRMAGVECCRNVASTWCDLRRVLPPGIFFSRPFDAQAFTASVALLLESYNSEASSNFSSGTMHTSRDDTDVLLNRVVRVMEEKAQDPIGFEYAQQASTALRSLVSLLRGDGSEPNELTVKIPLLGTITVQRKPAKRSTYTSTTNTPSQQNQNSAMPALDQVPSYPTSGYPMAEFQIPNHPELPHFSSSSVDDVFSWVINPNDELLFHDNLMFEDVSTLQQWQNQY